MKPTYNKIRGMVQGVKPAHTWAIGRPWAAIGWSDVLLPLVRHPAIGLSMAVRALRKPVADGLSIQNVSEKK